MEKENVKDGVQEIRLSSWREYLEKSIELFSTSPAFMYRGQSDSKWPLESSLDRHRKEYPKRKNLVGGIPPEFECPPLADEEHLCAFKNAIRGRRGDYASALSDDDYWVLGQHHGLKTPLLDWTRSPFVALFFAFEEDCPTSSTESRAVYALSTSSIATGTCKQAGVQIVHSVAESNARLLSQAGVLLKLPAQRDVEGLVREQFAGETHGATLTKITIPNEDRTDCLVTLNKMNINRMTLFPDIDGAAGFVNSLWQSGHEDLIAYLGAESSNQSE